MTPYERLVLDAVERIPRGRVLGYGDLAELVGAGSARSAGAVLARHGREVAWHRVVTAAGRVPPGHEREAGRRLRAEGLLLVGDRVDMRRARWDGAQPQVEAREE